MSVASVLVAPSQNDDCMLLVTDFMNETSRVPALFEHRFLSCESGGQVSLCIVMQDLKQARVPVIARVRSAQPLNQEVTETIHTIAQPVSAVHNYAAALEISLKRDKFDKAEALQWTEQLKSSTGRLVQALGRLRTLLRIDP